MSNDLFSPEYVEISKEALKDFNIAHVCYSPNKQEGLKYDAGKPPLDLIPRAALVAEAEVLDAGRAKYGRNNWRRGMEWSRLVAAALRHLTSWNEGEDTDPETGKSHLAHARSCLGFLLEYQDKGLGTDDRHKGHTS